METETLLSRLDLINMWAQNKMLCAEDCEFVESTTDEAIKVIASLPYAIGRKISRAQAETFIVQKLMEIKDICDQYAPCDMLNLCIRKNGEDVVFSAYNRYYNYKTVDFANPIDITIRNVGGADNA